MVDATDPHNPRSTLVGPVLALVVLAASLLMVWLYWRAAHEREMMVVVLSGHTGGALASRVRETDVLICVPHERAARVREAHELVVHCLCDGVDTQLLGEQEML